MKIDFRQWDKKNKEFHYWGENVDDVSGASFVSPATYVNKLFETEHEMYVGHRDSRGKKIYENDYLQIFMFLDSNPILALVTYNTEKAKFELMFEYPSSGRVGTLSNNVFKELERNATVVGNTHIGATRKGVYYADEK